jgi:soluble lytic murein transglycosylase
MARTCLRYASGSGGRLPKVAAALLVAAVAAFGAASAFGDQAPADVSADTAAVRKEFLAAMQRVRARAVEPPDSQALIAYPIYDYLQAARLHRDLDAHPSDDLDAMIDTFLQDRLTLPVTRALRRDWLASLAARSRWDWFLTRSADTRDPALECDRLVGRLSTGDTGKLAEDAMAVWLQAAQPPPECGGVFAWLHAQNLITPAAAEARTRMALAADNAHLAREFVADVPPERAGELMQWLRLLESPKAAIEELGSHLDTPVEPDALVAGYTHLSRTDATTALNVMPWLLKRVDMSADVAARLHRLAALGAAYDHLPMALAAFRAVPAEVVDDDVREWRIRAALWAGDFPAALEWIKQLPSTLASQPRWRYWRARATEATLGEDVAAPLYSDVAGMRDYYAYLAADRLHRPYDLNVHPTPDDGQAQSTLGVAPGMVRAHELFECNQLEDAAVEWAVVLADAEPATRIQASHLASHWGWYTQAITTLTAANEWDDLALRYPRPYDTLVARASTLTTLPGEWIYSVMRQESLFRPDATSRADARGLMQLQPRTAAQVAHRWHLAPPVRDALFNPASAIPLGAAYLKELLDKYHGELGLTLAAYDAGPWAVARWLPGRATDADVWVENIPYNETRTYVQRVLEHIVAYSREQPSGPPRLTTLLAPVPSAAGDPSLTRAAASRRPAHSALIESMGSPAHTDTAL